MAIFALCSCSNSEDSYTQNSFSFNNKEYAIDRADFRKSYVELWSGKNYFSVYNCEFEINKKNYLSAFESVQAQMTWYGSDGEHNCTTWEASNLTKDSYVTLRTNNEDNRTYIEVFVDDGKKRFKAVYNGTLEPNHDNEVVTPENEIDKIKGVHSAGILFPESEGYQKDSLQNFVCKIEDDGSYSIDGFPTQMLARYINDADIKKELESAPNVSFSGKFSTPIYYGFIIDNNDLQFKTKGNDDITISFDETTANYIANSGMVMYIKPIKISFNERTYYFENFGRNAILIEIYLLLK